jgi:hypothetical protein
VLGHMQVLELQPPADAGSSLADFSTLKMEAIRSSVTSVHTRSTRRHIPEDGILQEQQCMVALKRAVFLVPLLFLSPAGSHGDRVRARRFILSRGGAGVN